MSTIELRLILKTILRLLRAAKIVKFEINIDLGSGRHKFDVLNFDFETFKNFVDNSK